MTTREGACAPHNFLARRQSCGQPATTQRMSKMYALNLILALATAFCLIAGLLAAVGLGIGLAIHWGFPSIGLGDATIAGCVLAAASTFFLHKLISLTQRQVDPVDEPDELDESDDDLLDDRPIFILPRDLSRHLAAKSKSKSKPKRK